MSEQSEKSQKINAARLENISTAMLIICSATLFGLSTLKPEELSDKLQWALLCFSIGLPSSAFCFMLGVERKHLGKPISVVYNFPIVFILAALIILASIFSTIIGIGFLFAHFNYKIGVTFGLLTIFIIVFYFALSGAVDQQIFEESKQQQQDKTPKESEPPQQENSEKSTKKADEELSKESEPSQQEKST